MKNKEDHQTRRAKLLAERNACLARMSAGARRAFDQRRSCRTDATTGGGEGDDKGCDSQLTQKIRDLLAYAYRILRTAESKHDIRTALRAIDTVGRSLQLYGKATGEITTARRGPKPSARSVPSREEGVQTAADLLLALATAEELAGIIPRLQQRRQEFDSVGGTAAPASTAPSSAPADARPCRDHGCDNSEEVNLYSKS